jgi:hypothetical protein
MGGKPCRVALRAPKRGNQQMQPAGCWCGDPMSDRQSVQLSCEHTMHRDCWQGWQRSRHDVDEWGTCPLCRANISAPPDRSPDDENAARARGFMDNLGAYDVDDANMALMQLTEIAGEAPGATADDQAAMVRMLRLLPPELVADVADGQGPSDLEGAIGDALERVVSQPGLVDPRVAALIPRVSEALRGGRLVPMLARVVALGVARQGLVHELRARMEARYGHLARRWDDDRIRWVRQMMSSIPTELVHSLIHRELPPHEAAVRVWFAGRVPETIAPRDRQRIGQALLHGEVRASLRMLSGLVPRAEAARMRLVAPRVADFVYAASTPNPPSSRDEPYEPPRRVPEPEAFVSRLMSSASTEGVDERVRDEVASVLRALVRSWIGRGWGEREIVGIVRHPEQLAVQTLAAMLRNSWEAQALAGILRRLDRLSVQRAGMLGEALLRGEGPASLQLSAEEAELLRNMRFPAALFEGVVVVLQRALAGVE